MKNAFYALVMLAALSLSAFADPLLLTTPTPAFNITSQQGRDPYSSVRSGNSLTIRDGLDLNNLKGSVTYTFVASGPNGHYIDVAPGGSTTLNLGTITRVIVGNPGAAAFTPVFEYGLNFNGLTLAIGPPITVPGITGTLIGTNPLSLQSFGGNISSAGISSGGGYADLGDNVNTIFGTLSFKFPSEVITLVFNPATWVDNKLDVSVTITRSAVAAVPEPMTLVLLGSGLAGLAAMRKKRREVKTE